LELAMECQLSYRDITGKKFDRSARARKKKRSKRLADKRSKRREHMQRLKTVSWYQEKKKVSG
jgi:hypothetical protein